MLMCTVTVVWRGMQAFFGVCAEGWCDWHGRTFLSRDWGRAFCGQHAHFPRGDWLSAAGRGRVSSRRRLAAILAACHDGACHLGRQELPANETRTAAVWTVRALGFVDACPIPRIHSILAGLRRDRGNLVFLSWNCGISGRRVEKDRFLTGEGDQKRTTWPGESDRQGGGRSH